ncbi:hypothetical protein [Thermocoleostomius sinensis]|uniref:Uncharacterized protein n=1 Tax=Thermocoleostomius sinensis A174 TaxID=2016057 RepID=A0A9E8ZEV2_9CYAN|nr:hypothetical protein [Thermocoleostomius sinensis]WAL61536.1 hypothetical protein OXH18_05985 [Thermocoleostomius sinensis A174]
MSMSSSLPPSTKRRTRHKSAKRSNTNPILRLLPIAGLAAVAVVLMIDVGRMSLAGDQHRDEVCIGEVDDGVIISREQLATFLTIPERDRKARVQEVLQAPYCHLSNLEIRAGVPAERVVYPLAFDPNTWLVVLYEEEEYAGYQFRFAH